MDNSLSVNGRAITTTVADDRPLCDWLRDDIGLTGTKVGCREGVCGSCTIMLDGRPARSCLILAVQADGSEVTTIEGLAGEDGSDPIQRAFVEHGALQCGFCTPGFVMAARALLDDRPQLSRDEVVEGLAGNLCRCTGYAQIVEAVLAAADPAAPIAPSSEDG